MICPLQKCFIFLLTPCGSGAGAKLMNSYILEHFCLLIFNHIICVWEFVFYEFTHTFVYVNSCIYKFTFCMKSCIKTKKKVNQARDPNLPSTYQTLHRNIPNSTHKHTITNLPTVLHSFR